MNAFQIFSHNGRNHELGGDGDLELGVFYFLGSYNLFKLDLPAQLPYLSTSIHDGAWLKTFLTNKKYSNQYMSSSTNETTWLGKQDLIFNQNIDRVPYNNDSEIISADANSTRLLELYEIT